MGSVNGRARPDSIARSGREIVVEIAGKKIALRLQQGSGGNSLST
jgi:hypothetical protein